MINDINTRHNFTVCRPNEVPRVKLTLALTFVLLELKPHVSLRQNGMEILCINYIRTVKLCKHCLVIIFYIWGSSSAH